MKKTGKLMLVLSLLLLTVAGRAQMATGTGKLKGKKILFVVTSHDQMGNSGRKTGVWLHKFAAPYYALTDEGAEITIVSIRWFAYYRPESGISRGGSTGDR